MLSHFRRFSPYAVRLVTVFVLYLAAGKLGLAAPFTSGNVSPFWPASGIALASVLLWGYRVWPAIASAAFLVNFWSPIPTQAALGIAVGNTPGVLTETTADLAFALMMAVARLILPGVEYIRSGQWRTWDPMALLGRDIHGATLGIVGLGRIGTELAKRARGFDMRIIYFSRSRHEEAERELGVEYRDSLESVLREADFVSLHTPLTSETRHLMNERTLKLMKPTAALINTTRGPVVDTEALYDALKAGTIWAAGLDVTDPEPLPADHKLLTLDNCLVVPHIGSASIASRDAMARLAAENLLAGLEGRPLKASPNPEVRPGEKG